MGFFYRQRFKFGGEYLSLLAVETRKIREEYQDARIHFVLSCVSGSCPIVRPELPTGSALDEFLATAGDYEVVFHDYDWALNSSQ